ncbi:MAG: mRNA surveillance protein pelota [Candidatus Woesearchaeota archaeon]
MKILNIHKNEAKLVVENLDDLWCLSTIIDPADIVEGRTFRKIKIGGEDDRSQKIVKKPVFLKIEVEKVEFHKYSNVLRVSGKVAEGQEEIPKGSYHTFNVEEGTQLKLIKTEWFKYHKQRLEEASKEKRPDTLVCVFDREEAYIALIKQYGFEILLNLKGDVAKKADVKQPTKNFYEEIIKALQEYSTRHGVANIIVASPAFWKDELMKNLKDAELKKKIVFATCSSCDEGAINEVLRRPEVQTVLQKDRITTEIKAVEMLLSEISKEGAAAYGTDETENAANAGAVKVLLVTDALIQKERQEGDFTRINNLMKSADRSGAEIRIISSDHDGGKKLDGLGGIAAILRYKMTF